MKFVCVYGDRVRFVCSFMEIVFGFFDVVVLIKIFNKWFLVDYFFELLCLCDCVREVFDIGFFVS